MIHVEDFLLQLLGQEGDRYVFGVENSPEDPDPLAHDCSELIEWAGARLGVRPPIPDGSWIQWAHVERHGGELPLAEAEWTRGALLYRRPQGKAPGHVAVALGDGRTIEARGSAWGVGVFSALDRFERGGLIPGIDYQPRPPVWAHEEDPMSWTAVVPCLYQAQPEGEPFDHPRPTIKVVSNPDGDDPTKTAVISMWGAQLGGPEWSPGQRHPLGIWEDAQLPPELGGWWARVWMIGEVEDVLVYPDRVVAQFVDGRQQTIGAPWGQ